MIHFYKFFAFTHRLQNFEAASSDFKEVLDLDPGNAAALNQLKLIKEERRAEDVRLGNAMAKLFAPQKTVQTSNPKAVNL